MDTVRKTRKKTVKSNDTQQQSKKTVTGSTKSKKTTHRSTTKQTIKPKTIKIKKGGNTPSIPILPVNDLDMSQWKPISNNGQNNKGTWVNDNEGLFMIRKTAKVSLYNDIAHISLFPQVVRIYSDTPQSTENQDVYIVTKKLDGDMTSIFFSLIPSKAATEIAMEQYKSKNSNSNANSNTNKKRDNLKNELLNIFSMKMPRFRGTNYYIGHFELYMLENPESMDKYKVAYEEWLKKKEIDDEERRYRWIPQTPLEFESMTLSSPTSPEELKHDLQKLTELQNKQFTSVSEDTYDKFINLVRKYIYEVYPVICKQIEKCRYELLEYGYDYSDRKFDNYGYTLSDTPISRGKTEYSDTMYGRYVTPYIIDIESGLFAVDKTTIIENIESDRESKYTSYSVNGQYNLRTLQKNILLGPGVPDFIKNNSVLKLLSKDYTLDIKKEIELLPLSNI